MRGVGKQSYILMGKKELSRPEKVQLVRAYMLMQMTFVSLHHNTNDKKNIIVVPLH